MGFRMNENLVKYLAGLLDADGSASLRFRLRRNTDDCWYPGLNISLSSSEAVDRHGFVESLPVITGMGTVSRYGDQGQFKRWDVTKVSDVERLVPRLTKHMVVKAQHWQWLLETWRDVRGKEVDEVQKKALAELSKESRRSRIGPLKPKNHPSWAWVAGFLDGDGSYRHTFFPNQGRWNLSVNASAHKNDQIVLHFLQKAFGGSIRVHQPGVLIWSRGLGPMHSSFAMRFLPKVARHARLKRHKIDQMIHHHQQRLSALTPAGEATV